MQITKKILLIILIICLNSCIPTIKDQEQCMILIDLKVDEFGNRYINENESSCVCRMYRWDKNYVGPVGQAWETDITYCNKVIGHKPDPYIEFATFLEKIRRNCASNKRCR